MENRQLSDSHLICGHAGSVVEARTEDGAMRWRIALFCHEMSTREEPKRLQRERVTVRAMVTMFCRHHHGGPELCEECRELAEYADRKLDRCPYGGEKPACTKCPIHCYRTEPRERMREVMRYSGPRMLWTHPYLAIRHLLDERKEPVDLPKKG